MKRIVTHLLVAAGLAAGACGVAQAHGNLGIALSLGTPAPAYVQPAPVYAAPAPRPVYYAHWDRGGDRGWDRGWNRGGERDWDHRGWNRGDDHRWEYRDQNHRSWDHGRTWGNWRD